MQKTNNIAFFLCLTSIFIYLDRNRIFPQKEVENRPNYKESSVTKKKKRKFSALDHDTPKSPSLIKKSLRKESFDNFSLYQSKDLLTTAIKKVKSEEVSPLNTLKVPMNILECEENFMETEPQKKDCQLATLEEFDSVMMDIPIDIKYLSSCQKNGEYLVNSNYFGTKQPEMTWNMRVILLDWMMEVCNDYMLKRQTYYMAVNYVDRFLSSYYNIPKNKLQLLGVVSLYVASKLEEIYPPKIQDFALVGHDYGPEEIKNFEETLLKTLKFRLNPCTITFWADWMMFQWDMVIEEKEGVPDSLLMNFSHDSLQFKQPNENSYKLFREFYQLLDCAMLDAKSLLYDTKLIVLSFLCLLLWGTVNKIGLKSVQQRFPEIFLEDQRGFHKLMQEFLKRANNCNLESLRTTIEFCSVFLGLDLEYDYPRATNIDRENVLEVNICIFLFLNFLLIGTLCRFCRLSDA